MIFSETKLINSFKPLFYTKKSIFAISVNFVKNSSLKNDRFLNDKNILFVVEYWYCLLMGDFIMKNLKTSEKIIRRDIKEEDGNNYIYELIMSEDTKTASYKIPLYSIRLHMTDTEGNETSAGVHDIFSDMSKALSFYEKLVCNLATPIDLRYIVEDEIC